MPRKYLGFGRETLKPEKVSKKAKVFKRAKTSVDKNPSNTVMEVLNLPAHYMMLLVINQKINK